MNKLLSLLAPLLLVGTAFAIPALSVGEFKAGGPTSPFDPKVEVVCDLPVELRKHNISSGGEGCCVFRSLDHAAHYQNVPVLYGFPEWLVKKGLSGGGYDGNVTERIAAIAKDRGMTAPGYIQYSGKDPTILELALHTGRMPGVTYDGRDIRYSGTIGHMINLIYLDKEHACVLDNNFVGENELLWMTRQEFLERWAGQGSGWCVILLNSRPPSPPRN